MISSSPKQYLSGFCTKQFIFFVMHHALYQLYIPHSYEFHLLKNQRLLIPDHFNDIRLRLIDSVYAFIYTTIIIKPRDTYIKLGVDRDFTIEREVEHWDIFHFKPPPPHAIMDIIHVSCDSYYTNQFNFNLYYD